MATAPGGSSARIAVAIMAKAPRPGEVKTRLCPPLTPPQATEVYRSFLLDKIAQVRGLDGVAPVVAYTPDDARGEFARLAPGFSLLAQRGAGLGARLTAAVADLLGDGHDGVILLDTDTPTLPRAHLEEAVRALRRGTGEVVLGPTEDGGYYLVGLGAPAPALFEGIPWSTAGVLAATLERARAAGLRARLLPPWFDVDTGPDLDRLRAALDGAGVAAAPHTRACLAALGSR